MHFTALSTVKHDGKRYVEGTSLSLSKEEAAPLLAAGVIGADDKAAKAEAKAKAEAEAKAKAEAEAIEAAEARAKADASRHTDNT